MMADAASRGDAKEVQQRESWDQLKKRINASGNRANIGNIKDIIVELFGANLVRGRGLLCRLLMRAQSQSTSFTAVYAALVAVINTKLPLIGELMVTRLVLQFCRAFKRDDKGLCISSVMFLAHLSNQRVAHEVLAFQIVSLLLETPTDDSVEVVVAFTREVGAFLGSIVPRVLNYVFDAFRSILHEDRLTHIVITRDLLVMHATLSTEKIMRDLKIDGDLERRYESRLRYDSYKRVRRSQSHSYFKSRFPPSRRQADRSDTYNQYRSDRSNIRRDRYSARSKSPRPRSPRSPRSSSRRR